MTSSSRRQRNVPPPAGTPATKASIYARFIPREELSSFAAWEPGALSGGEERPVEAAVEEPPPVDPAELLAAQLRTARQSGYQDGYRDGLVALEGFKQSFAHQATTQVGVLVQSIGVQLDGLQQEMAEALVSTAISLARQVVRGELKAHPETIAGVAREAVDALMLSARHLTLRVHPDDHSLVAEGAGEVIAARGARLVADASVGRGGCLVESNIGLIDASVETRWLRAAATLGRDEPWNGGEAPAAGPHGASAAGPADAPRDATGRAT